MIRLPSIFIRRTPSQSSMEKYFLLSCILMLSYSSHPLIALIAIFCFTSSHIITCHSQAILRRLATACITKLYHPAFPPSYCNIFPVLTIQRRPARTSCVHRNEFNLASCILFNLRLRPVAIFYCSLYNATEQHVTKHGVITCPCAHDCVNDVSHDDTRWDF